MQTIFQKKSNRIFTNTSLFLFTVLLTLQACQKNPHLAPSESNFQQVNLVANNSSYGAAAVDANLVNAWGIAFGPSGPAWVSSNGAGLSTIYNAAGVTLRPPVTIPSNSSLTGGTPTGQVFNGSTGFKLPNGNPARFIFSGEDGVISGWNGGSAAVVAKNNMDAVYKGITIARNGGFPYLYVANFKGRKVEVYDSLWKAVNFPFMDWNLPADYSPFNVQSIGDKVFVVYAKLGSGHDEASGPGTGIIDIYNPDGTLVRRFISHGELNAPWGIAATPASFLSTATNMSVFLVGNFGNGRINSYDQNGLFLGPLRHKGKPIVIDGLWALSFAPATATTVNPNWLFFAAGPNGEADGLFGYITPEESEKMKVAN